MHSMGASLVPNRIYVLPNFYEIRPRPFSYPLHKPTIGHISGRHSTDKPGHIPTDPCLGPTIGLLVRVRETIATTTFIANF